MKLPKFLSKSRLSSILTVISMTALVISFQNCEIRRPSVEDMSFASVIYPHTGQETSCSSCHEDSRPLDTTGFLALNPDTPFDYNTHGAGYDCLTCHSGMTNTLRTRPDWANGYFEHPPSLTTCTNCHSSQRPGNSAADLARTNGFDHTTSGAGECFACHSASLNSRFISLSDWGGAVGAPGNKTWDIGNDISPFAQTPVFNGTTITTVNTVTPAQILHMAMNHKTSTVSASQIQNCNLCHTSGTYAGGKFHASILAAGIAQPATCAECHDSTNLPIGFVGPNPATPLTARNPTSNEMRHEATVWSKAANGSFQRTSIGIVNNDCKICHATPTANTVKGTGWRAGTFHAALTTNGLNQPSSCLDCHANSRPVGTVNNGTTPFDHATDSQGMGDCNACHGSTATWVGGKFHSPGITKPTSCNSCHGSQRPINTTGWVGYDPTTKPFDVLQTQNATGYHGGIRDCTTCHVPTKYTAKTDWAGGAFHSRTPAASLTTCFSCHTSQRPSAAIQPSATNGLSAAFDHMTSGLGDCIGCHKATVTRGIFNNYKTNNGNSWGDTDWRGGVSYDPVGLMGPDPSRAPTQVPSIRLNYSNPATFQVASTTNVSEPLIDQMKHGSSQVPSTFWTGGVVGSTLDTAKCVACHSNAPTSYIPGVFHINAPAAGLTSCKDCHVNTTPANIVGSSLRPMDHSAMLSGGQSAEASFDCISCHVSAQAGGSFSNATFHSKISTQSASTCTNCHYPSVPAGTFAFTGASTYTAGMRHASNYSTGDCIACHTMTNAQIVTKVNASGAVSTNWSGGLFHKNINPSTITSCSDCHTTKPAAVTVSNHSGQHMNHMAPSVGTDCATCHKSDLTAGQTPTAWSKSAQFHTSVTTGVTSCKTCHNLDQPAGIDNSTTLSTFPSGNTTLYDQISHTDTTVSTRDCNVCHTNVGMVGTRWSAAKFHTKVSVTSATNCLNCHSNILSYIRNNLGGIANGMDHSVASIGTQNCAVCHTFPGTGVLGSTTNPPNWKGAVGGLPATITLTPPSTATGWGNLTTPHPSMPLQGESCASCHGTAIGQKIIGYDHANPPTGMKCVYCHTTGQQIVNTTGLRFSTKGVTHEGGVSPTRDCNSCHNSTRYINFMFPTYSPTTGRWSGGKWK